MLALQTFPDQGREAPEQALWPTFGWAVDFVCRKGVHYELPKLRRDPHRRRDVLYELWRPTDSASGGSDIDVDASRHATCARASGLPAHATPVGHGDANASPADRVNEWGA